MLSIDHQLNIRGYTVYRDFQNENQYYYLPSEKPRIAGDGTKLQFVAYTDGEILEGDSPDFENEDDRIGSFLTLEVELGPAADEIEQIRGELSNRAGGDVNLSQAPFKDGSVKLFLFASDGTQSNGPTQVTIAGAAKPSLYGAQTAVFSARLGAKETQILWAVLKEKAQTQAAVQYELDFLGLMPAYNLEVTVDFKAVEDFWHHKFDASGAIEFGEADQQGRRNKIVASADIDWMLQELKNEGAIQVKQIVYSEGQEQTTLLGDDPTGMELVKKLLAPTLFQVAPVPSSDFSAVTDAVRNRSLATPRDADGDEDDNGGPGTPTVTTPTPEGPNPGEGRQENPPGDGNGTPQQPADPTGEAEESEGQPPASPDGDGENQTTTPPPGRPVENAEPNDPAANPETGTNRPSTGNGRPNQGGGDRAERESPEAVQDPHIDVKVGYSLRRREITQRVKRTFRFDKTEAKTHKIYPQGALEVAGTNFDPDRQVQLVRLGEGPFKEMEIEARASFDFALYRIQEVILHLSYGYRGRRGDKSNRLHEFSLTLTAAEPRKFVNFFVDQYGTLDYDYYVEFIHQPGSIIGTHETKITSRRFEDVTERDISVTIDDHLPLIPVEVQAGDLQFSDEGIRSVQVYLAPTPDGNGRTTILNAGSPTLAKYLIYPPAEGQYNYFRREEFFFQDEVLQFEEEEVKDAQVVVNTPQTHIFNIAPNLVNTGGLIRQALVDVRYRTAAGREKSATLNLTPEEPRKAIPILLDGEARREWNGRTRFVLTNGTILEGAWTTYDIAEPLINLDNSGFRAVKVFPLLGVNTFRGTVAAVQVTVFDPQNRDATATTVFLHSGQVEDTAVLTGIAPTRTLRAEATIFRNDGETELEEILIPPGTPRVVLPITDV